MTDQVTRLMYTQEYLAWDMPPANNSSSFQLETSIQGDHTMPTFNRSFDLSISEIDLIEESLRARGRELSNMRLALSDDNPDHLESIKEIDDEARDGEALLGKLHDQKIFYRPQEDVYVGG